MSRQIVITALAVALSALAGVSSDASTRGESGVRSTYGSGAHRSAHRVHAKRADRPTARPAAVEDPWAAWAARWRSEVGNCAPGWYCYPQRN
jgi:hypothetical protein